MPAARRRRWAVTVFRWIARLGGTVLLAVWIPHAMYELTRLLEEQSVYGERLFSIGFLVMMLGLLAGWLSDKAGAALLVSGYILAAAAPFFGTCSRPMLGPNAAGVAFAILPFLAVGVTYAFAGRVPRTFE